MKTIALACEIRENKGKKFARRLRSEGKVPCILYSNKEQTLFSTDEKLLQKLLHSAELNSVKLSIGEKEIDAMLQETQFHPVTDRVLHADFIEIFDNKLITGDLPVKIIGSSIGILEGGHLIQKMRRVKVRALLSKFPDFINVDITNITIGGSVNVGDIAFEGLEFLDPANTVIAWVKAARALIELEPKLGETAKLEETAEGEEKEGAGKEGDGKEGEGKEGEGKEGEGKKGEGKKGEGKKGEGKKAEEHSEPSKKGKK